ncbi:MAG TPA: peptidoglycan DD-metalloendopeptidase family protein, partial [Methylibium sp.]
MPRRLLGLAGIGVALVLAGCASSLHRAPVEDRSNSAARAASPTSNAGAELPSAEVKPPPPGAENAGKPGYYTVKPGDTLIRIGLETGQNWRDIGKWNNIDNPNLIEVGQVVRVLPPGADPNTAAARGVGSGNKLEGRPLDAKPGNAASAPAAVAQANPPAQPASGADDDVSWVWPAPGPVIAGFDEARNKGVSISGKAGDPVYAAADGRVVYAGSGLRGYGNLVIIKHNSTYLTAYA